jgi:L-fuculose-phosphate aldolase
MSNHGVVVYGADLDQAYMRMETVEHFARIALVTHQLGQQKPLGSADLEKLVVARAKYMGGANGTVHGPASTNGNERKKASAESASVQEAVSRRRVSQ